MITSHPNTKGFTFIEVIVAMAIFVLAVLAAVDIVHGSVRASQDAKKISEATWLLQAKMTELETLLENKGIEEGCDEEKSGGFDKPYDEFSWKSFCNQIDFYISETAAQVASSSGNEDDDEATKTNPIIKMILQTANKYISDSVRELHVEVAWTQGKNSQKVDATTHFVTYDTKVSLPGAGGTQSQSADPSSSSSSSSSGGN